MALRVTPIIMALVGVPLAILCDFISQPPTWSTNGPSSNISDRSLVTPELYASINITTRSMVASGASSDPTTLQSRGITPVSSPTQPMTPISPMSSPTQPMTPISPMSSPTQPMTPISPMSSGREKTASPDDNTTTGNNFTSPAMGQLTPTALLFVPESDPATMPVTFPQAYSTSSTAPTYPQKYPTSSTAPTFIFAETPETTTKPITPKTSIFVSPASKSVPNVSTETSTLSAESNITAPALPGTITAPKWYNVTRLLPPATTTAPLTSVVISSILLDAATAPLMSNVSQYKSQSTRAAPEASNDTPPVSTSLPVVPNITELAPLGSRTAPIASYMSQASPPGSSTNGVSGISTIPGMTGISIPTRTTMPTASTTNAPSPSAAITSYPTTVSMARTKSPAETRPVNSSCMTTASAAATLTPGTANNTDITHGTTEIQPTGIYKPDSKAGILALKIKLESSGIYPLTTQAILRLICFILTQELSTKHATVTWGPKRTQTSCDTYKDTLI